MPCPTTIQQPRKALAGCHGMANRPVSKQDLHGRNKRTEECVGKDIRDSRVPRSTFFPNLRGFDPATVFPPRLARHLYSHQPFGAETPNRPTSPNLSFVPFNSLVATDGSQSLQLPPHSVRPTLSPRSGRQVPTDPQL